MPLMAGGDGLRATLSSRSGWHRVASRASSAYFIDMDNAIASDDDLVRTWSLPYAARLGSSMRSKGLYMQVRAQLPKQMQKALTVKAGELSFRLPSDYSDAFVTALTIIEKALVGIEKREVIPREIEDILGISTTERRRWLADGRLPSLGTRTMKLRGRGTITFHVFDPRVVEEILDRDLVDAWREQDVERAAENRRRAAWKAKLKRAEEKTPNAPAKDRDGATRVKLRGWAAFERDGPLRRS